MATGKDLSLGEIEELYQQKIKTLTAERTKVLRDRPGKWLTERQIRIAIRRDTRKRVSRQSINVNLNQLEKARLVQRRPAPAGSGGAQYVYSAAGGRSSKTPKGRKEEPIETR